jgi:rod shape-determining protein MreC
MQNIFRFFQKYGTVFIFVILQLICMIFIFSKNNPYQHSKFANSSNRFIGEIYNTSNNVRAYFHLSEENELLRIQNQLLLNNSKRNRLVIGNYFSLKSDTLYMQQYYHQAVSVIQSTKDKGYNYLTIDKGSANGIKKNVGVIGTKGVLGYVIASSAHYSTILPVIHPKFILSVRHKKTNSLGLLTWETANNWETATLNDISDFIPLNIGDTIETSGGDGFFPEGELVGTIKKVEEIPGKGTQLITVKLIENYGNIHSAFAIKNITQSELEQLKDSTQINE